MAMIIGSSSLAVISQTPSSHAMMEEPSIDSSSVQSRHLELGGDHTRNSRGCTLDQHTFVFTMYTDAHSINDNSWKMSHASYGYGQETGNSGTEIASESVGGDMGYGAVLTHTICADKATVVDNVDDGGTSVIVESCYDLELRDTNGDGLTVPHSGLGGLAGGFSLYMDGAVVAEHRGKACLSDDMKEWTECAIKSGFEYCRLRVCTVNDGAGGAGAKATLGNLSGSQCTFAQPQCDADSDIKSSSSSISVNVDTDSFSQEISWEVRESSKSDSKKMNRALENELLLAGGMPVYDDSAASKNIVLGQLGVGVPLADNESYESIACLPDDGASKSCFDFRAYDTYGDGMGCGADGALSITIETAGTTMLGSPSRNRVSLTQLDDDMAKKQQVNGKKQLACMNKEKLSKWSYCAVRLCADGDVIALEGNQCDFGQGDDLIDEGYDGVDPLVGLEMRPQNGNGNGNDWPDEEEDVVAIQLEDLQLNIINAFDALQDDEEEEDVDQSWAEYYETLEPGFKDNPNSFSAGTGTMFSWSPPPQETMAGMISMTTNQDKPAKQQQGQSGPKPNRPNKQQGQKGPRPNKKPNKNNEDEPEQQSQKVDIQASSSLEELVLKSFSTNLLDVQFPSPLKDDRPSQMSNGISTYLLSYFDDNTNYEDFPITNFNLDCIKSKEKIGPEMLWVVDCDGTAEFQLPSSSSLPSKKAVNNVIKNAFMRKSKAKFLEVMYDYGDKKNKKQQKLEKLEAKKLQQQQLQQQQGTINIGEAMGGSEKTEKQQMKQEKIEAKKQMKLDRLEDKQQKQQQQQNGELNVMGYVSGTQYMNELSDSEKGYVILNGDIIVYVDDDKKGGGGRNKKQQRQQQQGRRKRNYEKEEEDGGDRRMLRRST